MAKRVWTDSEEEYGSLSDTGELSEKSSELLSEAFSRTIVVAIVVQGGKVKDALFKSVQLH